MYSYKKEFDKSGEFFFSFSIALNTEFLTHLLVKCTGGVWLCKGGCQNIVRGIREVRMAKTI